MKKNIYIFIVMLCCNLAITFALILYLPKTYKVEKVIEYGMINNEVVGSTLTTAYIFRTEGFQSNLLRDGRFTDYEGVKINITPVENSIAVKVKAKYPEDAVQGYLMVKNYVDKRFDVALENSLKVKYKNTFIRPLESMSETIPSRVDLNFWVFFVGQFVILVAAFLIIKEYFKGSE